MYVCVWMCVNVCVCVWMCMCVRGCVWMCLYIYIFIIFPHAPLHRVILHAGETFSCYYLIWIVLYFSLVLSFVFIHYSFSKSIDFVN